MIWIRPFWPLLLVCLLPGSLLGASLEEARALFRAGKYAECAATAAEVIAEGTSDEAWPLLKVRSELAGGKYSRALATLEAALRRHRRSLELRWLGREVYLYNDQPEEAEVLLSSIDRLARQSPWDYTDPASRVALGRYLLHRSADARQVLDLVYEPLKREHPEYLGVHVATGELALQKNDYVLATEAFEGALKLAPEDPDILSRLARAQAASDPARSRKTLLEALKHNPNHVDSLLLTADNLIDREEYEDAGEVLEQVLEVNDKHPEAWAYRAVLAHLAGELEAEKSYRSLALSSWSRNPQVDTLIGRKLSQKYRFLEASGYARQALEFDPDYIPAKIQLCQDLLRLGREEEGWRLAEEIHEQDNYNVVAYNLSILRDVLGKFRTIGDDSLVVRMDSREAGIYGDQVVDLLRRARAVLCAKYEVDLEEPTVVEIFPEQKDFAIRTFGLPGAAGFLGVCFGHVITANSPASGGESPSNWQAVLWHEFCHVVTLGKTANKMPRWLSEGISVYEERQANRTWGQSMTPKYREMVLGGEVTPVSQLSGAFLNPPSPLHLQFAYYESSLVVEFLIDRYGFGKLKRILSDLALGVAINDALGRHAAPLDELDAEVARFIRSQAEEFAPQADWEPPEFTADSDLTEILSWVNEHPNNFLGLQRYGAQLLLERQWQKAKEPLEKLLKLCPECTGANDAYWLLATAHRELSETEQERSVLERLAELDGEAAAAYLRLAELYRGVEDWPGLARNAERLLAVNPLIAAPHRDRARAAEAMGHPSKAIRSYRSLLVMEPLDSAELHYQLARQLRLTGERQAARREVLKALEEAPRFRDAHRLLLEVVAEFEDPAEETDPGEKKKREF